MSKGGVSKLLDFVNDKSNGKTLLEMWLEEQANHVAAREAKARTDNCRKRPFQAQESSITVAETASRLSTYLEDVLAKKLPGTL